MSTVAEKNKANWNAYAEKYTNYEHSDKKMNETAAEPANAFDPITWELIQRYAPILKGKKVCVPSSGDNHAVYAFVMLGACVTSCDISENQLANAERIAKQYGWDNSIEFICTDTMRLDGIKDSSYDFVYTSNGVHVWINDLNAMYRNIWRILKPDGVYIMYEIHPFQRPFTNNDGIVTRSYEETGPYESDSNVTFAWRVMDIMNSIFHSGFVVKHMEEILPKKNYDWPFWFRHEEILDGATATREEVDRRWLEHKMTMLPEMLCIVAHK
jgi:SAM-dependent methyltransferase